MSQVNRPDKTLPSPALASRENDATTATAEVRRLAQRIVSAVSPEQLILFGSRARGDARPDSDADFLVVMDVTSFGGSVRTAARHIRRLLWDRQLPVDIVVMTPTTFEQQRKAIGTIARPATREGHVLYAKGVYAR